LEPVRVAYKRSLRIQRLLNALELRSVCGGWWTRDDSDDEPRFVTTAEWLEMVTARRSDATALDIC